MSRYETIQIGWELLCGRMWHPNGVRTLSASPSQILDPHMRADYTYMPPKKPGSRRSRTSIRELTLSQEPGLPRLRPSTSIFKLQAGLGSLIPTLLLTICFTFPLLSIVAQLSMWPPTPSVAVASVSLALGAYYAGYIQVRLGAPAAEDESQRFSCRPFLPNLFAETPPTTDHSSIGAAATAADKFFTHRFSKGDIDSLSIAIVTSDGVLFEKNWGVIRGNESATSSPTTSHSQYRIASVSKLFTALEGLILEERGIISWCVLRPHVMLRTTNS